MVANIDETIVHVLNPAGDGEHTFCSLEIQEGSIDPADRDRFYGQDTELHEITGRLPNCRECKAAIEKIREAVKGLRFSKKLKSLDEEKENGY